MPNAEKATHSPPGLSEVTSTTKLGNGCVLVHQSLTKSITTSETGLRKVFEDP